MRWKNTYREPDEGEMRTVRKFAWTPITLSDGNYNIWLEFYESVQKYQTRLRPTKFGCITFAKWDEIERKSFVNAS